MSRRTPRTAQQKLRGFKKRHEQDYEKWLAQFPTRGETDEMIRVYLGQYHAAEVARLQDLVAELAKRAGIVEEPKPEAGDDRIDDGGGRGGEAGHDGDGAVGEGIAPAPCRPAVGG